MIYKTCPICGAALDPGERCDCRERSEKEPRKNREKPSSGIASTRGRQGR